MKAAITITQETTKGINTIAFVHYEIDNTTDNIVLNTEKLTQSLTKAVFKKFEATKAGIKTGFKLSAPLQLIVILDNNKVFDTANLESSCGMDDRIKVNASLYKKDANQAKENFQNTLKFIIESSQELESDFLNCLEQK